MAQGNWTHTVYGRRTSRGVEDLDEINANLTANKMCEGLGSEMLQVRRTSPSFVDDDDVIAWLNHHSNETPGKIPLV